MTFIAAYYNKTTGERYYWTLHVDSLPVMAQDDWESALTDNSCEAFTDKFGVNCWRNCVDNSTFAGDARDACEFWNIEPQQTEAYEQRKARWLSATLWA